MRFLKADKLFDGERFLAEDTVIVLDDKGVLRELVPDRTVEKSNIEVLAGIISPGFVNPHGHLELSHLFNKIPKHTGLPEFGKQVVTLRHKYHKEEIAEHLKSADETMWRSGIVAAGDISNGDHSFSQKTRSSVFYHTFIELIGLDPRNAISVFEKGQLLLQDLENLGLRGSFAAHAPYSTSKELLSLCYQHGKKKKLPFSIHNQESEEEMKFFEGRPNKFGELYQFLNLDISWFRAPGTSGLQNYAALLGEHPAILVHNTFCSKEDLAAVVDKNVFWCFCPGANHYIEKQLPDFSLFDGFRNSICVGTDSLASNSQLDLLVEINLIHYAGAPFAVEDLLRSITYNASKALMLEDRFGKLIIGKNTGLNLINVKNSELSLAKKLA